MRRRILAGLFLLPLSIAVAAEEPVRMLQAPVGRWSAYPFLFASETGLMMSWIERDGAKQSLRWARYREGAWSSPRTVVEREDLFVNWADFPSIVEDERGTLYAHWLQKSGSQQYAYDVRMSISRDGKRWSPPFLLHNDGTKTEHGFVSLAVLPGGGVAAVWLDGRNMTGDGHGHEGGGEMTLRYAVVSRSGQLSEERELDRRVCECCTTSMVMTSAGPLILYRDRNDEEVRDISFVRREASRWTNPRTLRRDGWKIEACPVNGPQIDALRDRVAAAWFTAAGDRQRVYLLFGTAEGRFGAPIVVDDGKPAGRVDVLIVDPNTALVSWLEQTASGAEIRMRRVRQGETIAPSVKVADSSMARGAGVPRLARMGEYVYVGWTEQSAEGSRVRLSSVPLSALTAAP